MSAILSTDDLNDFISPGVACIKPVETLPAQKPDDNHDPYEVTTEDKLPSQKRTTAEISLTDCLACSGCVTSTEAALVSHQSHAKVLKKLDKYSSIFSPASDEGFSPDEQRDETADGRLFVASVSPQVRASIAARYYVSEVEAGWMIDQLLQGPTGLASGGRYGNGFAWVVDTNTMREACLILGADEVTDLLSSSTTFTSSSSTDPPRRPILSSACPGWICYAEKTHPHVIPHLSHLKSPQALTGTLLKTVLSGRLNIRPKQIWHLAIMPCFDKKLEASRGELTDQYWRQPSPLDQQPPEKPARDVDCVITARELIMLAETRGIDFASLPRRPISKSSTPLFPDPILSSYLFPNARKRRRRNQEPAAGPSGGYLHHVLQTQLSEHPGSRLHTTRGRNTDVVEYSITQPSDPSPGAPHNDALMNGEPTSTAAAHAKSEKEETIFRAARYYGSRNITNLVRKLKPPASNRFNRLPGAARKIPKANGVTATAGGKPASNNLLTDYAYVEVMACPGGCTNGGGQIRVDDLEFAAGEERPSQKEWLARVDEAYFSMSDAYSSSDENGDVEMVDGHDEVEQEEEAMVNGIDIKNVRAMLEHWSRSTGIGLEKLCFTSFKAVESDVGRGAGGQERAVALAGREGGGW
ncbi:MAG: hypothetical protein Q9220_003482 [cf. Caloplaca sp. 1 TL-2023]